LLPHAGVKNLQTAQAELPDVESFHTDGEHRISEVRLKAAPRDPADAWHSSELVPRDGLTASVFSSAALSWYVRFAEEGATWLGITQDCTPRALLTQIATWLEENHPASVDRPTSLRVGVLLGEALRRASGFRWGYVRVDGTPTLALLSADDDYAVAPVDCLREALYVSTKDLEQMFDCLELGHLPPRDAENLTLLW